MCIQTHEATEDGVSFSVRSSVSSLSLWFVPWREADDTRTTPVADHGKLRALSAGRRAEAAGAGRGLDGGLGGRRRARPAPAQRRVTGRWAFGATNCWA